jgi:hypothetical protein
VLLKTPSCHAAEINAQNGDKNEFIEAYKKETKRAALQLY